MTHWPQNAYVGQKVIVIDDSPGRISGLLFPYKRNEQVTITEIDLNVPLKDLFGFAINGTWSTWSWRRFHPVQSTEKSMKILTEILLTQKIKENA